MMTWWRHLLKLRCGCMWCEAVRWCKRWDAWRERQREPERFEYR